MIAASIQIAGIPSACASGVKPAIGIGVALGDGVAEGMGGVIIGGASVPHAVAIAIRQVSRLMLQTLRFSMRRSLRGSC